MNYGLLVLLPMVFMAGPVLADAKTGQAQAQESERMAHEQERMAAEQERASATREKAMRDAEIKLEKARQQLAEAARRMAELGIQADSEHGVFRHLGTGGRKAMLGINIGAGGSSGGAGVLVEGVTPGGPADQAGIKSGDVITKLGETSLMADSERDSNRKLLKLMRELEPGQDVKLAYQRDGKSLQTSVRTKAADAMAFGFFDPDGEPGMPGPHGDWEIEMFNNDGPRVPGMGGEFFRRWGGMEMVSLTPALGEYFGTEKGLLVVRSPGQKDIDIRDGDVILQIGGRTPDSPAHATRILRSYQPGEKMSLQLVRKKKKMNIEVTLPEHKTSQWNDDHGDDEHRIRIMPGHDAPPAPAAPATRT